jgi:protein arginine kinase activator
LKRRREVEHLREQLQEAIAKEAFEDAAALRDQIRRLEASTAEEP